MRISAATVIILFVLAVGGVQTASAYIYSENGANGFLLTNTSLYSIHQFVDSNDADALTVTVNDYSQQANPYSYNISGVVLDTRFDENTGNTANDSSGNNNNGTFVGAGAINWSAAGKYNSAGNFNGSNDYLTIPDSTSLNTTNTATFMAWINTSQNMSGIFPGVVDKRDTTHIAYALTFRNTGVMWASYSYAGDPASNFASTTVAVNDGAWHLITGIKTPTQVCIYVDTIQKSCASNSNSYNATGTTLYVGTDNSHVAGRFLNGSMDSVLVFNRAWTQAELNSYYYSSLRQLRIGGNVGWQRFGQVVTATTALDEQNVYEPTVLYDTNPQIITGATNVFKMWYTGGWNTGYINYAESLTGLPGSWIKYSGNPIIKSSRSTVLKNNNTYHFYGMNASGWFHNTSTNGINWTNKSLALPLGTAGQWDSLDPGNIYVWIQDSTGINNSCLSGCTWYALYESRKAPDNIWKIGLANSTDGYTWTKNASNPVINETGSVGGMTNTLKANGYYYIWIHRSPTGGLPTDIFRYRSTDLINWNQFPNFSTVPRQTADEGVFTTVGQAADPNLVVFNNQTFIYYTASSDGSQQNGNASIKLAIYNGTMNSLVNDSTERGTIVSESGYWNSSSDNPISVTLSPSNVVANLFFDIPTSINFPSCCTINNSINTTKLNVSSVNITTSVFIGVNNTIDQNNGIAFDGLVHGLTRIKNLTVQPTSTNVTINILTWNTTGDFHKVFTASSPTHNNPTTFTIGDLPANTAIYMLIDGVAAASNVLISNSTGFVTFTQTGWSTHTFELTTTVQDTTHSSILISCNSAISWATIGFAMIVIVLLAAGGGMALMMLMNKTFDGGLLIRYVVAIVVIVVIGTVGLSIANPIVNLLGC